MSQVGRYDHVPEPGAERPLVGPEVAVVVSKYRGRAIGNGIRDKTATVAAGNTNAVGSPSLTPFVGAVNRLADCRRGHGTQTCVGREIEGCVEAESLFLANLAPRLGGWLGQHLKVPGQAGRIESWISNGRGLTGTKKSPGQKEYGQIVDLHYLQASNALSNPLAGQNGETGRPVWPLIDLPDVSSWLHYDLHAEMQAWDRATY